LLEGFTFIHELAEHNTHLSTVSRPLYIVSNYYWFLDGGIGRFKTWQADSHMFARGVHRDSRRYFFGENLCIKMFYLDKRERVEINLQEYNNEIAFLSNPTQGFNCPRLLQQGTNKHELWLVREQLPGKLLFDIIRSGEKYDVRHILHDILSQLVALEVAGLYHNDMRIWNVVIGPTGQASLIDYGAITKDKKDYVWSSNGIFLAFFIFIYEVTNAKMDFSDPIRTQSKNFYRLDPPYQNWLFAFWQISSDQWSFSLLEKLFMQLDELQKDNRIIVGDLQRYWIKAIEESVNVQVSFDSYIREQQLRTETKNKAFQKTMLNLPLMFCLSRRVLARLFLWPLRKMFANPCMKAKALNIIDKHPKLKKRLRAIAMRLGLIINRSAIKEQEEN
jgi:O-antigen chain-terminating methyltransferase